MEAVTSFLRHRVESSIRPFVGVETVYLISVWLVILWADCGTQFSSCSGKASIADRRLNPAILCCCKRKHQRWRKMTSVLGFARPIGSAPNFDLTGCLQPCAFFLDAEELISARVSNTGKGLVGRAVAVPSR